MTSLDSPASSEPTVFVVDDDEITRDVVAAILEMDDYRVETFASAEAFLEQISPERHGCLVLDMCLPGMSGSELQAELSQRGSPVPIIFMSAHGDVPTTVRAMRGGALDFLTKPIDPDSLLGCVRTALERDARHRRIHAHRQPFMVLMHSLSGREKEILNLALAGMQNKDIARRLDLSPRTVEAHRARLFLKLGVKSLIEVVNLIAELDIPPNDLPAASESSGAGEAGTPA
jgi:two-component system, LuxR family, response regulator FixJ